MPNSEHLKILGKGVEAWNAWREENPDLRPDLVGANLRNAELSGVNLGWAKLSRVRLSSADLSGANLAWADLGRVRLSNANLSGARLSWAKLSWTNLKKANLCGARLHGTSLFRANLLASNWVGAVLGGSVWADIDLSNCKGLPEVEHRYSSDLGVETLVKTAQGLRGDRSRQGEVEAFLRGAGVEEAYLELFRHQIVQPIQYFSCFISYSHADKPFARRLYDSLQGRGIRCWLDEHDMVAGGRITQEVNEAIRLNDKLLLCCSERSLQSSWVEDEIAAAIRKERDEGRDVLIPLDLDGSFTAWRGDHSVRIQERFAPNFTGWEADNAKFESEFEKVVQALRPREESEAHPEG